MVSLITKITKVEMKKFILTVISFYYVSCVLGQTVLDQKINLKSDYGMSLAIPMEFSYEQKPRLLFTQGYSQEEKTYVYDEDLKLEKTIDTGLNKTFDYQLTYQDEEREITEVYIKNETELQNFHQTFDQFVEQQKMVDPTFDISKMTITKEENGDSLIVYEGYYSPEDLYYGYSYFGKQYPKLVYRCISGNMYLYRINYGVKYGEWKTVSTRTEDYQKSFSALSLQSINLNQGQSQSNGSFKVSQTLFNTDEDFEFLMPKYILGTGGPYSNSDDTVIDGDDVILTKNTVCITENGKVVLGGFQVVSSDGTVLQDLDFDADFVSSGLPSKIFVLTIGTKTYLVFTGYQSGSSNESTAFYLINRETTNIQKAKVVRGGMSVTPVVAEKNSPVIISFGDDNKFGSDITLYSTSGSQLHQMRVPAGSKSAQMTLGNGSGVYVITRKQPGQMHESQKVIVK